MAPQLPSLPFPNPTFPITSAPTAPTAVAQSCGYFSENPTIHVGCYGPSTCSSSLGARNWGCCDSSSCYIPATCANAEACLCGSTTASLSPIMKCTYGLSSECVTFIRQTAEDDTAKVTSWGCDKSPTIYTILAESSSSFATSSKLPSQSSLSMSSSSGLGTGGKVGLGVGVAVGGLIIFGAVASIFYRAGKRSRGDQANNGDGSIGIVPKPELQGTQRLEDYGKQVSNHERLNNALPAPTERAELGVSGSAVELEGSCTVDSPAARS